VAYFPAESAACTIVDVAAAWWRIVDTHRLGGDFTPCGRTRNARAGKNGLGVPRAQTADEA
jgi:hypothetical protein